MFKCCIGSRCMATGDPRFGGYCPKCWDIKKIGIDIEFPDFESAVIPPAPKIPLKSKSCKSAMCNDAAEDRFFGYCLHCWAHEVPDCNKEKLRAAAKEGIATKCVRCGHERVAAFCAHCGARQAERRSIIESMGNILALLKTR